MQATRARFLRLRNMANLRSGRANAYFYKFLCTGSRGRPEKSRIWSLEKPPWICSLKNASVAYILGSLSNQDDDGDKNVTNLHIWQWKTEVLHALHVQFSFLDISQTFSFFLRREMTCFAVEWTTWAYDDKCSTLSAYLSSAGSNLIPGMFEHNLQAQWLWIIEK